MLQKLRSSSAGLAAKGLLILLIASFAVWGVQGYLSQRGQGDVVATVGEETITSSELATAFARDVRRFQAQGSDFTAEQARNLGLMDLALDRLIRGRLYDEASKWLGMGISDERIADAIRQEQLFYDDGGNFSRSRFEFLLRNSRMSEAQYVADLRRDVARREIINSLAFTDGAPTVIEKRLHLYRNEKRVAIMAVVPVDESLDVGIPDEETINQIHQEQAERYTAPERRSATYVLLTPQAAMRDVVITEEEVRARYEENVAQYTQPERRVVQQIRFEDEEKARKATELIGEGRSFSAVAKDVAGIDAESLDFGEFPTGQFPIPELSDTIADLQEGEVSQPVQSDFGWHIFRVTEIKPEQVKPFAEVRDEIEANLKSESAGDLLYDLSTALEDELAGGATLEDAASKLGLDVRTTGLLDIEGMDADGTMAEDLPEGEFLNTLFVTGEGEQSALSQTPAGNYYILRVDEIVPSKLRPLTDVRDEIVADWQAQQRREAAQERALAIVERIENGEKLSDIAPTEGLQIMESKPFTRNSDGAESELLTPVLISDLFRLEKGQATMAETDRGFVIAELKAVQPAGPTNTEELGRMIGNQMTGDVLRQFDAALREEFDVEVDEAALARTPLPQ